MGLFSSVIHVRDTEAKAVCKALSDSVPRWKFKLSEQRLAASPPHDAPEGGLLYLVSPRQGSWTTILEGHFAVEGAPHIAELAQALGATLATYTLALVVHDDDVLYYNLFHEGKALDSYNSNPQYFEVARISDEVIAEQRHDPLPFEAILPAGANPSALQAILDRGWWAACKADRLDKNGVPPRDESGFIFEGERMIAIGNLLQLHGSNDGYPFAGWASEPSIQWHAFQELRFERE